MKKLILNPERCKGCSLCIKVCPDKALEYDTENFNAHGCHPVKWKGSCRLCGMCYLICPDYVFEIRDEAALER